MRLNLRLMTLAVLATACALPAAARNPTAQERADIEQLAYRYIFALDWRDPQDYARAFAPDGVLTYGGGEARGREAIAKVIQGMRDREMARLKEGETGQGSGHSKHFISSMVIDVAEDGQSAVSQATWMLVGGLEPTIRGHGHYVDTLVKVNGEWLYSSRRTYNEQTKGRETLPFVNPVTNPAAYGLQPAAK